MVIRNPHTDGAGWHAHMTDSFGTSSEAFSNQSFVRIANAVADSQKPPTELQANAALALMGAIAPRDELEAAIAEQIIAAHMASLDFLHRARLNAGEYVETAAAYTSMATKVSRTMTAHVETLARLRSGGKQIHEVRYVYVNGPAVIGDNAQAVFGGPEGGVRTENVDQPHGQPALAYIPGSPVPALRSEDPGRDALSRAGDPGAEALQEPRGP